MRESSPPKDLQGINRTTWIVVVALLLLLDGLLFISPLVSLHNFAAIESKEVESDTIQVRTIITSELKQLLVTAGDYASWDDAYRFMEIQDPRFITSSLGETFYTKLRLNLFCFMQNDGTMAYGRSLAPNAPAPGEIPPHILAHLKPGAPLLSPMTPEQTVSGYISLPEGIMMVVARPVLTSEYRGPARGNLIIGRLLDETEIGQISNLSRFNVKTIPPSAGDFTRVRSLLERKDVAVRIENSDTVSGFFEIKDIYGAGAAVFRVDKSRVMYYQAKKTAWYLVAISAGLTCLAAVVIVSLNRRLHEVSSRKQKSDAQLVESLTRLSQMSIQLSIAEEQERGRIAGELHDQVGPNLLLCKMKMGQARAKLPERASDQEFEAMESLIDQSVSDIRSLTLQLRPPILANAGLEAALKWLAEEFHRKYGLTVELHDDKSGKPLSHEARSIVFQAVRELLLNIVKHAHVATAGIFLDRVAQTLQITVKDEGAGFDVREATGQGSGSNGFGLFNIRKKIEYFGGRISFESTPGHGTTITILFPLDETQEPEDNDEH